MPIVLTPETGAGIPGANTYATIEQADAYHQDQLYGATWAAANDDTKGRALISATRHLDANTEWLGERATLEQDLAWPRVDVEWQGFDAPPDWMPSPVVKATCHLAQLLIDNDLQADQSSDGIKKLGLGSGAVEIEFKDENKTRRMPLVINEILQGIGATMAGGINQRKVTR